MFLGDNIDVLRSDLRVHRAFRIYDDDRTLGAQAETAGLYDLNFVRYSEFFQLVSQALSQFVRIGGKTSGTSAD